MTILTSEVRKQKLREVKALAQGHRAEGQLLSTPCWVEMRLSFPRTPEDEAL